MAGHLEPKVFHDEVNVAPETVRQYAADEHVDEGQNWVEGNAFDPSLFAELVGRSTAKLKSFISDQSVRGLRLIDPTVLARRAKELATPVVDGLPHLDRFEAILNLFLETGIPVYSTGYMGRQFSGVLPLAGVVDFVSSLVNQPCAFYEAAQLPNVAERLMAEEFGGLIGWPAGRFAMLTTSGGSLANLTAMLAARNDKFPRFWPEGTAGLVGCRPAVAVGAEAHYCVRRAVGVLGVGETNIVRLPGDDRGRICPARAAEELDAAAGRGLEVFCLVASAGTTSLGACDPLDELADLAAARRMWFHVDGAHGASLLVSDKLRSRLKGIERADSFVWDAHKLLFVPGVCTLLFYKDASKARRAFRQEASYVFDTEPTVYNALDTADETVECTKRPMIMPLWVAWALHGRGLFARKIEYLCRLARRAYEALCLEPDFEPIHEPEMNILCFRYAHAPAGPPDFQVAIRDRIRERGAFFISKVDVAGRPALRVVFMNHRADVGHFRSLLSEVRAVAAELASGWPRPAPPGA
jgi:L-2,4-diaminobutyrate decarboxylase